MVEVRRGLWVVELSASLKVGCSGTPGWFVGRAGVISVPGSFFFWFLQNSIVSDFYTFLFL